MRKIDVLDHGYVELIDYLGGDSAIVDAARISYSGRPKKLSDASLIKQLYLMGHTSPFEQGVIKFKIKCPIFVARQIMRHRTARINEVSGRYSKSGLDFYTPDKHDYSRVSDKDTWHRFVNDVEEIYCRASSLYSENVQAGIPKEMARILLPVNLYTEFYWQIDIHNLMGFLKLRLSSSTQHETRLFAAAIYRLTKTVFPASMAAIRNVNKELFHE
jgi:thymidylate synthase (FAD)